MNPSPKGPEGSEQCQDDCTGENFLCKRAVSQIDRKQWGTKRDLDRFYVNMVRRDQTALGCHNHYRSTQTVKNRSESIVIGANRRHVWYQDVECPEKYLKLNTLERSRGSSNKDRLLQMYDLIQLPTYGDSLMRIHNRERSKDTVGKIHTTDWWSNNCEVFYVL